MQHAPEKAPGAVVLSVTEEFAMRVLLKEDPFVNEDDPAGCCGGNTDLVR